MAECSDESAGHGEEEAWHQCGLKKLLKWKYRLYRGMKKLCMPPVCYGGIIKGCLKYSSRLMKEAVVPTAQRSMWSGCCSKTDGMGVQPGGRKDTGLPETHN